MPLAPQLQVPEQLDLPPAAQIGLNPCLIAPNRASSQRADSARNRSVPISAGVSPATMHAAETRSVIAPPLP